MSATALVSKKFDRLVSDISAIVDRTGEAVGRTLAEARREIGRRIVEDEQDGEIRAAYGKGLLKAISQELLEKHGKGFSVDNLEDARRFYLTNKKSATSRKLSLSQAIELMPLRNSDLRKVVRQKALRKHLSVRKIRELVRQTRMESGELADPPSADPGSAKEDKQVGAVRITAPLKVPKDLRLRTCKVSTFEQGVTVPNGHVKLELGFFRRDVVTRAQADTLLVTDKPSYIYEACVERVIDADTLIAEVDLTLGRAVSIRFRLRGVYAPELGTREGEDAARYMTALLPVGTRLVVHSHLVDRNGRFLADVWLQDSKAANGLGLFVNQDLLDKGLASPVPEEGA